MEEKRTYHHMDGTPYEVKVEKRMQRFSDGHQEEVEVEVMKPGDMIKDILADREYQWAIHRRIITALSVATGVFAVISAFLLWMVLYGGR